MLRVGNALTVAGVDGLVVAPDDGFVHGERAILVGVVQAFPVQGVELRLADDFDGEFLTV